MAQFYNTSGTADFTLTRDGLIARALRICSVLADAEVPQSDMLANGSTALNALVKQWDAMGIHLWTESEGVIFLQPLQKDYELNPRSSPDHAAADWLLTSLSITAAAAATSLSFASITAFRKSEISMGDHIGIVLDNGTVFWTAVSFLNPGDTTLQIQIALPSQATSGNSIFVYTKPILQPLRVVSARRKILNSLIEIPLSQYARLDYQEMPNKETTGIVNAYFYDPQLFTGFMHLWPTPSDASYVVTITWYRRIQDFVSAGDTPDLPQEWVNCLCWNLAKELGPEYDVPPQKYQIIMQRAAETLDMCQGFDRESESVFFGLNNYR